MAKVCKENEIEREFVRQMEVWSKTGEHPQMAGLDLQYAFDLQRERIEKKRAQVLYEFQSGKDAIVHAVMKENKSGGFRNVLAFREYQSKITYRAGEKKKLRYRRDTFYANVTDMEDQDTQTTYCCPDCAMIRPIQQFLEGCPGCGRKFCITDFYPKVTNYYTVNQGLLHRNFVSLWQKVFPLVGAVLGGICEYVIIGQLWTILLGAALGAILGGMALAIVLFTALVWKAGASLPMLFATITARMQLPGPIKKYEPKFSYEFFQGKIMNLLRMVVFSDDRENLPVYEGETLEKAFDDVIDLQYRGGFGVSSVQCKDGLASVNLRVYVTAVYEKDGDIREKDEIWKVTLCKCVDKPEDYGFSIRKVECKNCSGSFDSAKEKHCPYCGTSYDMKEDDWVILKLSS